MIRHRVGGHGGGNIPDPTKLLKTLRFSVNEVHEK